MNTLVTSTGLPAADTRPVSGVWAQRLPIAIELARLPDAIRGYGHIKAAAMQRAAEKREALLARWRAGGHRPANVA